MSTKNTQVSKPRKNVHMHNKKKIKNKWLKKTKKNKQNKNKTSGAKKTLY